MSFRAVRYVPLLSAFALSACSSVEKVYILPDAEVSSDAATVDASSELDASPELDAAGEDAAVDAAPLADSGPDASTRPPTRFADVLFVIDNSGTMEQEQASLRAAIPGFVRTLATGDVLDNDSVGTPATLEDNFPPFEGVNFGVVTTDLGTGGVTIQTCNLQPNGEDGNLRDRGEGPSCAASYPSVTTWTAPEDPATATSTVSCIANVGTNGCGFEQQLEAMRLALDGRNDGFLREDSTLIVVMITDENDCSNDPFTSRLFDESDPVVGGTSLNLRCVQFSDRLHAISRYVDTLDAIAEERPVVFGVISGMPTALVPAPSEAVTAATIDTILADDDMVFDVDPLIPNQLLSACTSTTGRADPAVRLLGVARGLGENVALESICASDYSNFIRALGYRIAALR